jgi:hypothetical protein
MLLGICTQTDETTKRNKDHLLGIKARGMALLSTESFVAKVKNGHECIGASYNVNQEIQQVL